MRLDAHKGDQGWMVWDCQALRAPRIRCVGYAVLMGQQLPIDTHQVKRIETATALRTVLINPIPDDQDVEHEVRMEFEA